MNKSSNKTFGELDVGDYIGMISLGDEPTSKSYKITEKQWSYLLLDDDETFFLNNNTKDKEVYQEEDVIYFSNDEIISKYLQRYREKVERLFSDIFNTSIDLMQNVEKD